MPRPFLLLLALSTFFSFSWLSFSLYVSLSLSPFYLPLSLSIWQHEKARDGCLCLWQLSVRPACSLGRDQATELLSESGRSVMNRSADDPPTPSTHSPLGECRERHWSEEQWGDAHLKKNTLFHSRFCDSYHTVTELQCGHGIISCLCCMHSRNAAESSMDLNGRPSVQRSDSSSMMFCASDSYNSASSPYTCHESLRDDTRQPRFSRQIHCPLLNPCGCGS